MLRFPFGGFFGVITGGFLGFIVGGLLDWFNSSERKRIGEGNKCTVK